MYKFTKHRYKKSKVRAKKYMFREDMRAKYVQKFKSACSDSFL